MKDNFASGKVQFISKSEMKNITKKARKIERPELIISKEESYLRAQKMIEFLSLTHPQNVGEGFKNPIEIKFLLRGEGSTTSLGSHFSLYRLDSESELEHLAKKIEENSKFSHCMYVSLFTYNKDKEVKVPITDKNGKSTFEHKKLHKIVRENAVETSVLPMDLDKITYEEYQYNREYFKKLGIDTTGIYTGYGYQMYILLKKPIKTKKVFEEFTTRLMKLGIPVDPSITDPSRVFRMPYSRNCKSYSSDFVYYSPYNAAGIETTVVDWSVQRYDHKDIFKILDEEYQRLNRSEVVETPNNEVSEVTTNKVLVETKRAEKLNSNDISKYEELYKHLVYSELPLNIQKMLRGTVEGYRNLCVLYLTQYINKVLGLTQEQAVETLQTFNNLCSPSMPDDKLKSDYYRVSEVYAHYNKGMYGPKMVEMFGPEELDTLISADFDEILFDNEVIKQFNDIPHTAIKIYLTMKLMEIDLETKEFTKEEIVTAANISMSTLERNIKELTKRSIVVNAKNVSKKLGGKKRLKINIYGAFINGFTKLSRPLVKDMLRELHPTELALYVYFMSKAKGMDKTMVFTSQKKIAEDTGLTQQNVSLVTENLKEKHYIRKKTIMSNQNRKKTTYTLRMN